MPQHALAGVPLIPGILPGLLPISPPGAALPAPAPRPPEMPHAPHAPPGPPGPPRDAPSPLRRALRSALGGGIPGAAAMGVQVTALMWLRTTMNYQYRTGTALPAALRALYAEGGVRRFYAGYPAAMIQAPLSRFGDTAANAGTLSLLAAHPATADLPIAVKTSVASLAAASFRIFLMPVDTVKSVLQAHGSTAGSAVLRAKLAAGGPAVLFHGALGASAATFAGHYPWFVVYNTLNARFPPAPRGLASGSAPCAGESRAAELGRAAAIGFAASVASDTTSNALRVLKTVRQVSETSVGYVASARAIVAAEGAAGLFGRGLKTRLLANGIQGVLFSVAWRLGQDAWGARV